MASERPNKRRDRSNSPINETADSAVIQPYAPEWTPADIEKRPVTTPPALNAWVPLCGNMTGDLWHCAAATILWEYQRIGGHSPAFPDWCPNTALIVWGYLEENKDGTKNTSITRGAGTYGFMERINVVPTLVAVEPGAGNTDNLSLGNQLVSSAIETRRVTQLASIGDFSNKTETETLKNLYDVSKFAGQPQGPVNDTLMFPLWASTAVVMQLIENIGVTSALKILGHRFSLGMDSEMIRIANMRVGKLVKKIEQVKSEQGVSKVLIFLYRIGDMNPQHDSNDDLLDFVRGQASKRKIGVIIIPQMGPEKFSTKVPDFVESAANSAASGEVSKDKKSRADVNKNYYFDIFGDLEGDDAPKGKQITAFIWSLIARKLQCGSRVADEAGDGGSSPRRDLVGVIGGRSGSLDLASFVGVNCMSWTEPLFTAFKARKKGSLNYDPKFFDNQGPQICRLLNQAPIMRVCYLDAESRATTLKTTWDRKAYTELKADALLTGWLEQEGRILQTDAEILDLLPEDVKSNEALALLKEYLPSVEKDTDKLGIKAIWLRKLIAKLENDKPEANLASNAGGSGSSSSAPTIALPLR